MDADIIIYKNEMKGVDWQHFSSRCLLLGELEIQGIRNNGDNFYLLIFQDDPVEGKRPPGN
jgi:hypothetical protein